MISATKILRVLSLDGGGYLGLATACFIAGIEEHFRVRLHDHFDLFCGTSTGAILALSLAQGKSGRDLVSFYKTLGPKVFGKKRLSKGWVQAKYSGFPLEQALVSKFGDATLGDLMNSGKNVLVTAYNISTGRPRIFKTDHTAGLTRDNGLRLVQVAMASASAPTFFPSYSIQGVGLSEELYCDGGVAANQPALLGYTEAISYLGYPPSQVRILSVSTPRQSLASLTANKYKDRGNLLWAAELPQIFTDSNSYLQHRILECITQSAGEAGAIYRRIEMPNSFKLPMDRVDNEATVHLESIGCDAANTPAHRKAVNDILELKA